MPDTSSLASFGVERGWPQPLGTSPVPGGVNFSLFSLNDTGVELLVFATHDAPEPFQAIRLDPSVNKSFHFWDVFVRGLQARAHYAYRVDGPSDAASGHRFNTNKVLIHPYARGNTNAVWKRDAACGPDANVATSMRSVVIDTTDYDWEGDCPLQHPMEDTVIYEMHVRGFTQSLSSEVRIPGHS
jgi:isoamylase